MNYLPRSRINSGYRRSILILLSIFIVGAILFSFLNTTIITLVSPLWRAENVFSRTLGQTLDYFHTRKNLVAENESLKEKVTSLELEISTLSLSASQKETLLELLGRRVEDGGVVAGVLTHPPQSPYDLIITDAGARDQVNIGARVKLLEGPEIGMVSEVASGFSKVRLFSTSGEETNAVLERHQVAVVLEGVGAGNFRISVPRETQVEVGDKILSPALDSSLLAVVEEIKVSPTDSFKEVFAKGPANIFNIRFVSIIP